MAAPAPPHIAMAELTVSTKVSAPPERVFAVFTDLEKAAERVPDIKALEVLSEGPFGEGTRWRETRVVMKKESTEEMWVTACDPPRSYTVEAESHGMHYASVFTFTPEGDGTTVSWTFSGKPLSLGTKIFAPLFNLLMKGALRKMMRGDLEALRDACERGA